ncbi:MAG: histidine kinase [Sphingobacteriales bacterium]|nr:MAG: histidine kinase [Sphingobacteriales bacterium]
MIILKKQLTNIWPFKENKQILYLLVLVFLLVIAATLYLNEWSVYAVAAMWIITVIVLLWLGNRYFFRLLDKRVPWLKHTTKRFFLQLPISLIYSLCCINITYYLFKINTSAVPPDTEQMLVLNIYGLLFIIPVLSLNFGVYFMVQWKNAHVQADQLKEENLNSRLEALKMHLDPHFLFNNLNVLSELIAQKPAVAQQFLDKFVDVYRYVLQYKKEELVPLETELDFIGSYVFLLKKRFEEQCVVDININSSLLANHAIPPLALQMLVENAFKHNKLSAEQPLIITIFNEENSYITVRNNYMPKEVFGNAIGSTGLDNIIKRYKYLSDSEVKIAQDEEYFEVSLPLLEIEED